MQSPAYYIFYADGKQKQLSINLQIAKLLNLFDNSNKIYVAYSHWS